jgi:hypothetical protein
MCRGQLLADWRWGMGCWLWMVDLLETLQHITMTYVSVQLLADWRRGTGVGCSSISWLWGFLHPTGGLGLVWPTNSLLSSSSQDYDFTLPSSILLIEYEHYCTHRFVLGYCCKCRDCRWWICFFHILLVSSFSFVAFGRKKIHIVFPC